MVDFFKNFNKWRGVPENKLRDPKVDDVIVATFIDLDTGKVSSPDTLKAAKYKGFDDNDLGYSSNDNDLGYPSQGTAYLVAQYTNGLPSVRNHFIAGANDKYGGGAFGSFATAKGSRVTPPSPMNTIATA